MVEVAEVTFFAANATLNLGTSSQLTFEIRDQDGNLLDPIDVAITFTSDDEDIATVSVTGLVTPLAAGTAVITIRVGTVSDNILIAVNPDIGSLDITEGDFDLLSSETVLLHVEVFDTEGDPLPNPPITFSTSDRFIASVSAEGVVGPGAAGEATITATAGALTDSLVVTVLSSNSGGVFAWNNNFTPRLGT